MSGQHTAVFGVFSDDSQAEKAVSRLTSAGFSNSDISVLESTIEGMLLGFEIPEHHQPYAKEAGLLILVHCLDALEIDRANTILEQSGAERIFATGERALSTPGLKRP